MSVESVCEEENGLFEALDFEVHLMSLNMGLELGKIVDSTLAMGGSNHIGRIMANVGCDFAPGSLDSGDRVGECTVLAKC